MTRLAGALLLAMGLVPAARAQFQLSAVAGNSEQPVASVYDFGRVASGDLASAHFRIGNTSNATAMLTVLTVAGTGFTLSGAPALPATLPPQAEVDFTVNFTATGLGSYSATISADGISAQLAAEVVTGLTFQVETAAGTISLGNSVEFGPAPVGHAATLQFDIGNQTGLPLPVPAMSLSSGDFAFSGAVPSGVLQPGQATTFIVQFLPTVTGQRSATLTIGARNYALTGTGLAAAPPNPQLTINLPQAQSGRQGSVQIVFDSAPANAGSGTLTLVFQPAAADATDPTIVFASGGLSAAFTFGAGDTQVSFNGQPSAGFQTGTTAGTLVFTAEVGSANAHQTVSIAPAPVGLTAATATRSTGSVTVQLDGFDNTRTATALSFLFFDAAGNTLAGPIAVNGGPGFQAYFPASETGGSFQLLAVFPVTGNPAQIASFQASVTNQAGTATTAPTPF